MYASAEMAGLHYGHHDTLSCITPCSLLQACSCDVLAAAERRLSCASAAVHAYAAAGQTISEHTTSEIVPGVSIHF